MRSLILDTMLFYQTLFVSLADCFLLSGEAITFKVTTARILTLQYCIELMGQREEQINKRPPYDVVESTLREVEEDLEMKKQLKGLVETKCRN